MHQVANPLSVGKIIDNGHTVLFTKKKAIIKHKKRKMQMQATTEDNGILLFHTKIIMSANINGS